MVIGNKNKLNGIQDVNTAVNNEPIKMVSHFKYLALYIDQHLAWDYHIYYIHDEASKTLRAIRKTRNCLNKTTAVQL